MRKIIASCIVLLVIMLCFSGCDKIQQTEPTEAPIAKLKRVEYGELIFGIPETYEKDDSAKKDTKQWKQESPLSVIKISKETAYDINEHVPEITRKQFEKSNGSMDTQFINLIGYDAIESTFPIKNGTMTILLLETENYVYELSISGNTDAYNKIKKSIKLKS